MSFDLDYIVESGLKTIRATQKVIRENIFVDAASAFAPLFDGRNLKPLLAVDLVAEHKAVVELHHQLQRKYTHITIGEERLRDTSFNLAKEDKLVVLVDMIDGTDLLERGLSNWCSAMVFYYPPERRILASIVAIPNDYAYFAREDIDSAFKCLIHKRAEVMEVVGPSEVRNLDSASLAFYGQKVANFLSVADHPTFISHLKDLDGSHGGKLKTRVYNLAGNPMMMRLIDGHSRIDAVFDLEGQAPHDVVPGAYIAQKAGAIFCDLKGKPIDLEDLAQALIRPADPNSRISYILSSTEELSRELQKFLADN